jgi:hypothetical protein
MENDIISYLSYTILYSESRHDVKLRWEGRDANKHNWYHGVILPEFHSWQRIVKNCNREEILIMIKNLHKDYIERDKIEVDDIINQVNSWIKEEKYENISELKSKLKI